MRQLRRWLEDNYKNNRSSMLLAMVASLSVVGVGAVLLGTHAATSTANSEPEAGSRTANALLVTDISASGGKAIKFSAPTGGSTSCAVSTPHVPDGPDGMGGCWPGPSNTGIPAGTKLSTWTTYPYLKDAGTVIIDSKIIPYIQAYGNTNVIIRNSQVNGFMDIASTASLVIEDSNIDAGSTSLGAIDGSNITVRRSNITGGQHSVHCASNCVVENSWLHAQYNATGQSYHTNAFISNGGSNITITHNTLHCDSILNSTDGGCTGDVTLLGDFANITNALVQKNLLRANNSSISYCARGGYSPSKPYPLATYVRYLDNIFERGANNKCGVYGPVTGFQTTATGNVWSGNKWTDGALVQPAE
jgi:hypothetical protein